MYFLGDDYLGSYSNNDDILNITTNEDNFGLDDYEPKFFHPPAEWTEYGDFSVTLKFDDPDFTSDIFYFCHVSLSQTKAGYVLVCLLLVHGSRLLAVLKSPISVSMPVVDSSVHERTDQGAQRWNPNPARADS